MKNKPESSHTQGKKKQEKQLKINQKIDNFGFELNEEQKEARQLIMDNDITVLTGNAGSGKTAVAVYCAIEMLFKKEIKKVVAVRPAVATENLGYLPGTLEEKLFPWNLPIIHNFRQVLTNQSLVDTWMKDKTLELFSMQFARGITYLDSFIIVDEAQNCSDAQLLMLLTRLGLGSKMVVCGDAQQIDLRKRTDSGLPFLSSLNINSLASMELKKNHRLPIVTEIVNSYALKSVFEN